MGILQILNYFQLLTRSSNPSVQHIAAYEKVGVETGKQLIPVLNLIGSVSSQETWSFCDLCS